MLKYSGFFLALICLLHAEADAKKGIRLGVGFEYLPIIKLDFARSTEANTEIFDNFIWQGRLSYDFGNGFKAGVLFDYLSRTFSPDPFRTSDLSLWGIGLTGDYGYEITESGHTLLVGGAELGAGHFNDKSGIFSGKAGSFWIAGFGGLRFLIFHTLWLEPDYKVSFQKYGPFGELQKKYILSGSSLRLLLEYPF